MTKVDSLVEEALALPADEREELARRIAATVDVDPNHEQAWDREIARRLGRIDRDEVEVMDMEEFDRLAWDIPIEPGPNR